MPSTAMQPNSARVCARYGWLMGTPSSAGVPARVTGEVAAHVGVDEPDPDGALEAETVAAETAGRGDLAQPVADLEVAHAGVVRRAGR